MEALTSKIMCQLTSGNACRCRLLARCLPKWHLTLLHKRNSLGPAMILYCFWNALVGLAGHPLLASSHATFEGCKHSFILVNHTRLCESSNSTFHFLHCFQVPRNTEAEAYRAFSERLLRVKPSFLKDTKKSSSMVLRRPTANSPFAVVLLFTKLSSLKTGERSHGCCVPVADAECLFRTIFSTFCAPKKKRFNS